MSEQPYEVTTAFMVVVQRGGDIAVLSNDFPAITVDRVATLTDVETFCSQAAREAGRLVEAERRKAVDPPATERVRKAVSRRKAAT